MELLSAFVKLSSAFASLLFLLCAMELLIINANFSLSAGVVDVIELYAGADNKDLDVGLYRPVNSNPCDFTLVKQITLENLEAGVNIVRNTAFCTHRIHLC